MTQHSGGLNNSNGTYYLSHTKIHITLYINDLNFTNTVTLLCSDHHVPPAVTASGVGASPFTQSTDIHIESRTTLHIRAVTSADRQAEH